METKSKLLERKGILAKELKDLVKGSGATLNSDEESKFERISSELESIEKTIEIQERASKYEAIENEYVGSRQEESPDKAERSAQLEYLRMGERMSDKSRNILQKRGTDPQTAGTTTAGGYYVDKKFSDSVSEVMKAHGGILAHINVNNSDTGAPFYIPTEDTTSQKGAIITETTADVVLDYAIGQASLGAYTYTSKIIQLSWELLQDNIYNAESRVINIAGKRLGRIFSDHLAVGTGTGQPQGYIVGAGSAAVTTASATVVTPDEILDLIHSLDPAYRNGAFLVFNDVTLKALRKFKSTTNEPIWQPSFGSTPATIYGVPYVVDLAMASVGTTAYKFMAYGNFNEAFYVRKVLGEQLVVMKEKYADQRMNGYFVFSRMDAKVINSSAIKIMQHA